MDCKGFAIGAILVAIMLPAWAQVPRSLPRVGEVVSVRGDEQVYFAGETTSRPLLTGQALAQGDRIVTGNFGAAVLVFRDDSQIRLQRRSEFVVGAVRDGSTIQTSRFELLAGALWSRAKPLFRALTAAVKQRPDAIEMNTPIVTIGIRGTDWHVETDPADGRTVLTILSGEGQMSNSLGQVTVAPGEQAIGEKGKAPVKRTVIDLRDRALFVLHLDPSKLDLLSLSGKSRSVLAAEVRALESRDLQALSTQEIGELAAAYVDLDRLSEADQLLRSGASSGLEVTVIEGAIALRRGHFARAEESFGRAAANVDGRARQVAVLGRAAALIGLGRYRDAEALLAEAGPAESPDADALLHRAYLIAASGRHDEAIALAVQSQPRFAADARLQVLLAYLYLLTDRLEEMERASEQATQLDPLSPYAWNVHGMSREIAHRDFAGAEDAWRQALVHDPDFAAALNNLGFLRFQLGDIEESGRLLRAAVDARPGDATHEINYAYFLANIDELKDAEQYFRRAMATEPDEPNALTGMAYLDIQAGRLQSAIDNALRAVAVDPSTPAAGFALASAYYAAGRRQDGNRALEDAARTDPDDPSIPLTASTIAVDESRAGDAVRLAREGFAAIERTGTEVFESLPSTASGAATVGLAYANLGLDEWGNYYTQLSSSPYSAHTNFFLSGIYGEESRRAAVGAQRQGSLLDTTAVAVRNRYYEPIRRPFIEFTGAGGYDLHEGRDNYRASAFTQGYASAPQPLAWSLNVVKNSSGGFTSESVSRLDGAAFAIGTRFDERRHNLLFTGTVARSRGELGSPGDDEDNLITELNLGYQLRLDYDNRLLFNIYTRKAELETFNADSFGEDLAGSGVSGLDYALINSFGIDGARLLYSLGLSDVSDDSPLGDLFNPVLVAGDRGRPLFDTIPLELDSNPLIRERADFRAYAVQVRHFFDLGPLSISYGAEWFPNEFELRERRFDVDAMSVGCATVDELECVLTFPFGPPLAVTDRNSFEVESFTAHTQARWRLSSAFWADAGVLYRSQDIKTFPITEQWDPRFGVAWRVTPRDWLRLSAQRNLNNDVSAAELAPVDVVGLVARDTLVLAGGSSDELRLRWESEWTPQVFTAIEGLHQEIEPFISDDGTFIEKAVLQRLSLAVNVWFLDRFGAFARGALQDSENRSNGPERNKEIPLLPESLASVGLVWVHPRQLRLTTAARYTGTRPFDLENSRDLDGYWTLDTSLNWQPWDKHLSFTLGATNLLDEDTETSASSLRVTGRIVSATAELRF